MSLERPFSGASPASSPIMSAARWALKEFFQKATDLRIVASAREIVTGGISFQSRAVAVSPYFEFVYHRSRWAFSGLGFPGCED